MAYLDSKFGFYSDGGSENYVNIRMNTLGNVNLEIETYYPVYYTVKWATNNIETHRIPRNGKKKFGYFSDVSTDREVLLYLPQSIKKINGLDSLKPASIDISKATKLTEISCKSDKLYSVSLTNNKYLRKIDFNGCKLLGTDTVSTLTLIYAKYLNYVDVRGTQLTAVNFSDKGGSLEKCYLPSTLTSLTVKNQMLLTDLILPYGENGEEIAQNLATVEISNCPYIKRVSEIEGENMFAVMKYCRSLILNNSFNLETMDFNGFTRLQNITLSNIDALKDIGLNDLCEAGTASNLKYVGVSACLNLKTINMNCSSSDYVITFADDGLLDLSTSNVTTIHSNCIIKGLKTIVVPRTIEEMYFTNDYGSGYSDIKNIWSTSSSVIDSSGVFPSAKHMDAETFITDDYIGIDFYGLHLNNIDLGALVNIPEAINFTLYPTNVNPNFNLNRNGTSLPYLQPVGTLDLSNYTGSLAKFFNGVDLDKLKIVCDKTLPQTNYSYCLYNAKFESVDTLTALLNCIGLISNGSYMFAETIIDNVDIMNQVSFNNGAIIDFMFSGSKVGNIDNLNLASSIASAKGFVKGCKLLTSAKNMTINVNGPIDEFLMNCTNLGSIDNTVVNNATSINYVLYNCNKIIPNIKSWDLSKCNSMQYALSGTNINNSTLDLSGVTLGTSNCDYSNLLNGNSDVTINLVNSSININGIEKIIIGLNNAKLDLTNHDLSKRTDFTSWFEDSNLAKIIVNGVIWGENLIFDKAFKNSKITEDFLLPLTTISCIECFNNIPTLKSIHSNWNQNFKKITPTNCYNGSINITNIDGIEVTNSYTTGLDDIPISWGGLGFLKDVTGIYEFEIPEDNYEIFITETFEDGAINWGDGTLDKVGIVTGTGNSESTVTYVSHVYKKAGTYIIKGKTWLSYNLNYGTGFACHSSVRQVLTRVIQVPSKTTSGTGFSKNGCISSTFKECLKLKYVDISNVTTSLISLVQCFYGDTALEEIKFNTNILSSSITFNSAFYNCTNLKFNSDSLPRLVNATSLYINNAFNGCSKNVELDDEEQYELDLTSLVNNRENISINDLGYCFTSSGFTKITMPRNFKVTNKGVDGRTTFNSCKNIIEIDFNGGKMYHGDLRNTISSNPNLTTINFTDCEFYNISHCSGFISSNPKLTNIIGIVDLRNVSNNNVGFDSAFASNPLITDLSNILLPEKSGRYDSMCKGCAALVKLPTTPNNTFKSDNMSLMLSDCKSLVDISEYTFEIVTNSSAANGGMNSMFRNSNNIEHIGKLIVRGSVRTIFAGCDNLKKIDEYNFAQTINNLDTYLLWQGAIELTDVIFKGTTPPAFTGSNNNSTFSIPPFSRSTAVSLFNALGSAEVGAGITLLKLNRQTFASLTSSDISIATNKGWSVS